MDQLVDNLDEGDQPDRYDDARDSHRLGAEAPEKKLLHRGAGAPHLRHSAGWALLRLHGYGTGEALCLLQNK